MDQKPVCYLARYSGEINHLALFPAISRLVSCYIKTAIYFHQDDGVSVVITVYKPVTSLLWHFWCINIPPHRPSGPNLFNCVKTNRRGGASVITSINSTLAPRSSSASRLAGANWRSPGEHFHSSLGNRSAAGVRDQAEPQLRYELWRAGKHKQGQGNLLLTLSIVLGTLPRASREEESTAAGRSTAPRLSGWAGTFDCCRSH